MKNRFIKLLAACILVGTLQAAEYGNAAGAADLFGNTDNGSSNFRSTNFSRHKYDNHEKIKKLKAKHRKSKAHSDKSFARYESKHIPM